MPFLRANIDRAIVMTQYDLRGFGHPLGFRQKKMSSPKSFSAIAGNFVGFAAGFGHEGAVSTDEAYADRFDSSFEDYLAMCKRLANDCDLSEKEAIQLIIREIVSQSKKMRAEVAAGKRPYSPYLKPIEKDNDWGKVVLALAEAFGVVIE